MANAPTFRLFVELHLGVTVDRRDFLRRAAIVGGAAAVGSRMGSVLADPLASPVGGAVKPLVDSILNLPAGESPVDHIVVLMMENRSFDHYLGWLATDDEYLARGRSRYGSGFGVDGNVGYTDPSTGTATRHWASVPEENPYRGCGHPDPGHGWTHGRAQRDLGFLAPGSGNDEFALGYYLANDIPFYADLARQFTIFDHYHCSVLGPTFPNREYMHSAQSGGLKTNKLPPQVPGHELGFTWDTIWDRLLAAGVSVGYYFVDLPAIGLWGPRLFPVARHIEQFFADCAAGTLPRIVFVDPGFTTGLRTDDHPFADIRAGQRYVANVFKAFKESTHWERGAFFVNYDEWGGFFDNQAPARFADDSVVHPLDAAAPGDPLDDDDFGQGGFRVPCLMASPYAQPGFVDHTLYDHTSILRFIEWRYLGAPATGTGGAGWYLTERDRAANNIGLTLAAAPTGADIDTTRLYELPVTSAPCHGEEAEGIPGSPVHGLPHQQAAPASGGHETEMHAFEHAMRAGFFERVGFPVRLDHPGADILG